MTVTRPDERIIKALRRVIDELELTQHPAEYRYDDAPRHPLTGAQIFQTGMYMGRERKFSELVEFLGDKGYIDGVQWYPGHDRHDYLQLTIHYDGGIWVTNCFVWDASHAFGVTGTKFFGNGPDANYDLPELMRRHVLETEDDVVKHVLEYIQRRD